MPEVVAVVVMVVVVVAVGLDVVFVKVMSSSESFDKVEGGDGEECAGTLNRSCPW